MADQSYTVETARAAAERDELAEWVAGFLASPGSDNAPLGEELTSRPRWWLGPVKVPIDQLNRLAGPPGDPVLRPTTEDEWREDVDDLEDKVDDGWEPPPVVVTFRDDQLVLEDGNHRVEGIRRTGETEAWAVIGFEDPELRERFTVPRS